VFKFLKNQDFLVKTDQDLISGPALKPEYRELDFVEARGPKDFTFDSKGGTTPVEFVYHVDGDTTRVKIPLFTGSNITDTNSIRYYWNQCPESTTNQTVSPQAWGFPASNLIKKIVTAITPEDEFLVQSAIDETIVDTYGRYLGLLWLNGQCLNYINVRAGTTEFAGNSTSKLGWFDDREVSYFGWFYNAELRASKYKWGVWNDYYLGQPSKDPMWDYTNRVRLNGVEDYYPPLHDELSIY
ncbi:MAG: hypothetical protein LBM99_02215, partial [Bacillales bacterium]|nr:hypothetical protein [Bacillales bacterium]